jgi:hypothetical protein
MFQQILLNGRSMKESFSHYIKRTLDFFRRSYIFITIDSETALKFVGGHHSTVQGIVI